MLTLKFKAVRRAAVPIVAIETADQQEAIRELIQTTNGNPAIQWDVIRGCVGLNNSGIQVVTELCQGEDPAMVTGNPTEMLSRIVRLPERSVVFMMNAHRFIQNETVVQGICNLRDIFKGTGSTLVLLVSEIQLPSELKQDVMILTEALPNATTLLNVIQQICTDAGMEMPEDSEKLIDTLIGLSAFSAEQTLATCIQKVNGVVGIDRKALWERKCKAIEQTPGLSIWRGKETFADIGGCENVKTFVEKVVNGGDAPRAIVFIDEIEKAFAGSGSDSSGVSQDQLGAILSFMQDKEVDGMIFIGPPGAAKSAVAKAAGNTGNIPTVSFDLGAMKNSLVGKSGEQTRQALKVIEAISQGRTLFIATCNSIGVLPPELRRRFTMGTFFFDLPTKEERNLIWNIYLSKYGFGENGIGIELPNDEGWTGAEIKQCAKLSSKLGISLVDASAYIVPVAKSAAEQIETLRRQASGKFISASNPGVYNINTGADAATPKRKFE